MLADTGTFFSVDLYDGEWALEHGTPRAGHGDDAQAGETQVGAEDCCVARSSTACGSFRHRQRRLPARPRCPAVRQVRPLRDDAARRDPDGDDGGRRGDGLVGSRGPLAVGRFADLVAVEGDPLEDIIELERPAAVVKGGTVVLAPVEARA